MLSRAEIRQLRERWKELPDFSLRGALLPEGPGSPFGRTDRDLEDYRGCVVDDSLHQLTIERADFSYCIVGKGQFCSTVRGCLFIGARLEQHLGETFEDCDFSGANLRNATSGCAFFTRCQFVGANLRVMRATRVEFVDCNFDEGNLKWAELVECHFVRCSFRDCRFGSGSLGGSVFEECVFENADLSTTVLRGSKGLEQFPGYRW